MRVYPILQNSHLANIDFYDSKLETNGENFLSKKVYDFWYHLKKTEMFVFSSRIIQVVPLYYEKCFV